MKKVRIFAAILLTVMLLLCLCGCVRYEEPNGYMAVCNGPGVSYTIDTSEKWLKYDNVMYYYNVVREDNRITYSVTYPNGASYTEIRDGDSVQSHWAGEHEIELPSGNTLVGILDNYYYLQEFKPHFFNWLGAVVLIIMGLFQALCPETAWEWGHLRTSWMYQSIEPTDDGLLWTRFGGVVIIILGVLVFFLKWH